MTTATEPEKALRSGVKVIKHIYDWSELVSLIDAQARPKADSQTSHRARQRVIDLYGSKHPFAQLDDRTFAKPSASHISLVYFRTPPGCDQLEVQEGVQVFPAAGGRTTYRIDKRLDGHFCNRMLPLKAKDRNTRSAYADHTWFCGMSQVYQPGVGMYYPDVGPDCMNMSRDQLLAKLDAGPVGWPQELRDAARGLVADVSKRVSPFPDARIRYELFASEDRPTMMVTRPQLRWHGAINLVAQSGLRIRIKSPCDGVHCTEMVPDMCLSVMSRPGGCTTFTDVMYAIEMLWPHGRFSHHHSSDKSDWPEMDFVSDKCKAYLSAAEQWCASHVYIPA